MLTHALSDSPIPAFWNQWQPALLALLVALAARFGGKSFKLPLLTTAAAPLGAMAGWGVLGSISFAADAKPLEKLAVIGVIGLLAALAGNVRKLAPALPVFAAVAGAWWLSGMPHTRAELMAQLPQLVVITAAATLVILRLRAASPWTILAAAVALWGALDVVGAKREWLLMALALCGACLALLSRAPAGGGDGDGSGIDDTGPATVVAFAAVVADLGLGKLSHGGLAGADIACFAPVFTSLVAPLLGSADIVVGSALASAGGVALVWLGSLMLTYGV